jgi:hypothetical protein
MVLTPPGSAPEILVHDEKCMVNEDHIEAYYDDSMSSMLPHNGKKILSEQSVPRLVHRDYKKSSTSSTTTMNLIPSLR